MKIDHQGYYEYRFSLIVIDFNGFHRFAKKNEMDKRLALFTIKGKEFKENCTELLEPFKRLTFQRPI